MEPAAYLYVSHNHEATGTIGNEPTYYEKLVGKFCVSGVIVGQDPKCSREKSKCGNQGEEDDDEDHVGPKGAYKVYDRQQAHKHQPEACGISSTWRARSIREGVSPKLALNPRVAMPSAGDLASAGAYDENAANEGFSVPPNASQKQPKLQKTMEGKLFPRTHSMMPLRSMRTPPMKK